MKITFSLEIVAMEGIVNLIIKAISILNVRSVLMSFVLRVFWNIRDEMEDSLDFWIDINLSE